MGRSPARFPLLAAVLTLAACSGDGSWGVEEAPRARAATISRSLGETVTLHGPNSRVLQVTLEFVHRPVVPVTLSSEDATFLEVHLSVLNSGPASFSGVLADAADLSVVPSGTLAPVSSDTVPSEIALTGGIDFSDPLTLPPGSPALRGKVVFQIDPDAEPASFSLTIPGGRETAQWTL